MSDKKGHILELQNFSVNDGAGIRTVVFFAGCPLRCRWCSNPEALHSPDRISWLETTCIGCGNCREICPQGIGIDLNSARAACTSCGKCLEVCPTGSRRRLVHLVSAEEILSRIDKQEPFYRYSGGGVTFSGGEATSQPEFLRTLSTALYDRGVHLALETSGYFDFEEVRDILERMDLIFIDIKVLDPLKHLEYTGVDNGRILENLKKLGARDREIVVRIPVIEGCNDDDENIRSTARFVAQVMPRPKIELLPYHSFGDEKYQALGLHLPPRRFKTPTAGRLEELSAIIKREGAEVVSYR